MTEKLDDLLVFRIITLDYPIKNGTGETITELKMRRAKARDIRRMSEKNTEAEQEFFMFSQLVGLVPEDIDELDMADYAKLQTAFKEMVKGKSA